MSRTCARPGCNAGAVATLTYDYAGRQVWLGDLAPERHPMGYDLCLEHAEGLRVPLGWSVDDRRSPFPHALAS